MESARTRPIPELLPPEVLTLPKVEIPVDGVTGYCLSDDRKQVVFFVFEEGVSFPDHAHCEQRRDHHHRCRACCARHSAPLSRQPARPSLRAS